jgi:hypothetical protein
MDVAKTMNRNVGRNTLLAIPLIEERYGRFFFVSIAFHGLLILLILFGGYLLPSRPPLYLGGGPGGGPGGDITTVGIVDLPAGSKSGGDRSMIKPSPIPQPSPLPKQPKVKNTQSITLPGKRQPKDTKPAKVPSKQDTNLISNIIPTTVPEAGNGGNPANMAGTGGGAGGGNGIFIGPGSGGVGDDWYSRQVAARISQNWNRPVDGTHVEMVYSFYISANGTLYNINKEKSSGNEAMDLTALQALSASYNPDPLPSPPLEIRRVKFIARFIYPSKP